MSFKIVTQLQLSLSTVNCFIAFLTQHMSIFDPNLGLKQPRIIFFFEWKWTNTTERKYSVWVFHEDVL